MSDNFYTAHAELEKVKGVHRRVQLEAGAAFDVGVHGAIKEHYRLDQEADRPLPVDFIVGAAGA